MNRKILLSFVIVSLLTISCSSNDTPATTDPVSLTDQIAAIVKQPYSTLSPANRKIKLEAEANSMLTRMDKLKTSGAIEAIQNLGNLLSKSSVDIFNGKNHNQIAEILNISGVYGIYSWDNSKQIWVKTASTTELKFVFPAKKSLTTNNASLSTKSTSSTIKVTIPDTEGSWTYNPNTGTYVQTPSINDEIYLPTSVDAILTIDNLQAATIASNSKYTGTVESPDESSFKITLNDGYVFEMSGKKAAANNSASSSLTYNGQNIVSFAVGSTADIDGLMKDNALVSYQGKANALYQIMDDFVIVASIDIAGLTNDQDALNNTLVNLDWNAKTYYTDLNANNLKEANGNVAAYNKNVKLLLVSKKDGTKIADVIQRSEKGYSYTSNSVWVTSNNSYGGYWNYSSMSFS